jgi:hypothetical protein
LGYFHWATLATHLMRLPYQCSYNLDLEPAKALYCLHDFLCTTSKWGILELS